MLDNVLDGTVGNTIDSLLDRHDECCVFCFRIFGCGTVLDRNSQSRQRRDHYNRRPVLIQKTISNLHSTISTIPNKIKKLPSQRQMNSNSISNTGRSAITGTWHTKPNTNEQPYSLIGMSQPIHSTPLSKYTRLIQKCFASRAKPGALRTL